MVGCWEREKGVKGKNKTFALHKQVIIHSFMVHEEQFWIGLWDADEFSFEFGIIVGHSSGTIHWAVGYVNRTYTGRLGFEKRFESHQHTEFVNGSCRLG